MVAAEYDARFSGLERVAENLATLIREHLKGVPRIDRVSSRAKSPERFMAKAAKSPVLPVPPSMRIPWRRFKIRSVLVSSCGTRVMWKAVAEVLERYFRPLERKDHVPDSHWEFGYFGLHWIFALPGDVIPTDMEEHNVPRFSNFR